MQLVILKKSLTAFFIQEFLRRGGGEFFCKNAMFPLWVDMEFWEF